MKYTDPTGHAVADDNVGGCDLPACASLPTIPSIPGLTDPLPPDVNDAVSEIVFYLDATGLVVSGVEAGATIVIGGALMGVGCLGGAETLGLTCLASWEIAKGLDAYFAAPYGLGLLENVLGYASLFGTIAVDQNNAWAFDGNGNLSGATLGKDTIISTRNSAIGTYPSSLVDLYVSASQFDYDLDRKYNGKLNEPILIGRQGGMTAQEGLKFLQVLGTNGWWAPWK